MSEITEVRGRGDALAAARWLDGALHHQPEAQRVVRSLWDWLDTGIDHRLLDRFGAQLADLGRLVDEMRPADAEPAAEAEAECVNIMAVDPLRIDIGGRVVERWFLTDGSNTVLGGQHYAPTEADPERGIRSWNCWQYTEHASIAAGVAMVAACVGGGGSSYNHFGVVRAFQWTADR